MSSRVGPFDDPDRYGLIELRSRGGEGELWRGSITVDGSELYVAVKIVHERNISDLAEWRDRWQRQAELLRSLEHPALVKVREVFEGPIPHEEGASNPESRTLYLVMNWSQGITIEEWVSRNPNRDLLEGVRVIARVASAVDYLHSGSVTGNPVLHRDIKPANVLINDSEVRLVDFGFVRVLSGSSMTLAGTPSYMAPELVAGHSFSKASDRFALGSTAFFVITGEPPTLDDYAAMRLKLMSSRGMDAREDLADHVLAMMDPDPVRRPDSAVGWAQTLAAKAVSDVGPTIISARASSGATEDGGSTMIRQRGLVANPATSAPTGPSGGRAASPVTPPSQPVRGAMAPLPRPSESAEKALNPGRGKRWVALIAVLALLIGGGVGVGLVLRASSTGKVGGPGPAPESTPTMLAVQSLTLEAAQKKLQEAGIAFDIQYEESFEPVGTVVRSLPAAGEAISGRVTLYVARAPSTMPNVLNKTEAEARTLLEGLGINVTTTYVLDESALDGTVIAQNPKAGEKVPSKVTLTVARQPVTRYLEELEPAEGGPSSKGVTNISGNAYPRSLVFSLNGTDSKFADYEIGRDYREFRATIGLQDESRPEMKVLFEIFLDGRKVKSYTLTIGKTASVQVNVTNVLRLKLVMTQTGNIGCSYCTAGSAVWGDARLLGVLGEVPEPTPSS